MLFTPINTTYQFVAPKEVRLGVDHVECVQHGLNSVDPPCRLYLSAGRTLSALGVNREHASDD